MKKKIDILNGNIYTSLIWFALPIALSSFLQQLFSTADQVYLSYFFINAYGQALTTFCGQNYGAKNLERCKKTIKAGLMESIIVVAAFDILVNITGFRYSIV